MQCNAAPRKQAKTDARITDEGMRFYTLTMQAQRVDVATLLAVYV